MTKDDLRAAEERVRANAREAILAAGGTEAEFRAAWGRVVILFWHVVQRERAGEPIVAAAADRVVEAWRLGDAFH